MNPTGAAKSGVGLANVLREWSSTGYLLSNLDKEKVSFGRPAQVTAPSEYFGLDFHPRVRKVDDIVGFELLEADLYLVEFAIAPAWKGANIQPARLEKSANPFVGGKCASSSLTRAQETLVCGWLSTGKEAFAPYVCVDTVGGNSYSLMASDSRKRRYRPSELDPETREIPAELAAHVSNLAGVLNASHAQHKLVLTANIILRNYATRNQRIFVPSIGHHQDHSYFTVDSHLHPEIGIHGYSKFTSPIWRDPDFAAGLQVWNSIHKPEWVQDKPFMQQFCRYLNEDKLRKAQRRIANLQMIETLRADPDVVRNARHHSRDKAAAIIRNRFSISHEIAISVASASSEGIESMLTRPLDEEREKLESRILALKEARTLPEFRMAS